MTRSTRAEAGAASGSALAALEHRLGYVFKEPDLLKRALTHRSAGADNWERLEFLGDAALGFIVGRLLFDAMDDASEQQLTIIRANLVNGEALAGVATEVGLGEFLSLGAAARKSRVAENSSVRADALEAVLGAVVCDGGLEAATEVARRLFATRLAKTTEMDQKDPKTRLQETLQARRLELPNYTVAETTGEDHDRTYRVACAVAELGLRAEGSGRSLRAAEKRAAAGVLLRLETELADDE